MNSIYLRIRPIVNFIYRLLRKIFDMGNTYSQNKVYKQIEKERTGAKVANLSYYVEDSIESGIRSYTSGEDRRFKRPYDLIRKGPSRMETLHIQCKRDENRKYAEAIKEVITLKELSASKWLRNKSVRVFVDTMDDSKIIVRDRTAFFEMDLGTIYDIAGEFVLINLNKTGDVIKINYILRD